MMRVIVSMEPVSVTDLANYVELDRSTVGRNGRVLERMELVKMSSQGVDQREARLSLTEKGHQVVRRGLPLWDSVQLGVEERLGPEKARQLRRLLASL
jgi:DNA-binding MarR family transcriptional regulator